MNFLAVYDKPDSLKFPVPENPPIRDGNFETSNPEADDPERSTLVVIKVIGTGGGGSNAVDRMIESGLSGVEFIVVNTDLQDLRKNKAKTKIQIGCKLTGGKGAGGNPEIGESAAKEDRDRIVEAVKGADMVFVAVGMGGGTGTGSAPEIARIARENGALTVGVATKPFDFEGTVKKRHAETGIKRLREAVDTLITIPNQHLFSVVDRSVPLPQVYRIADDVWGQGVQGISDLITKTGVVNVDFADVKSAMRNKGDALMGIGYGKGKDRAIEAAKKAIENPLLEDTTIEGATHILVNITSSEDISLMEVEEAIKTIRAKADPDVDLTHGVRFDPKMEDAIQITVIATGFPAGNRINQKVIIPYDQWEGILDGTKRPSGFLSHRNSPDVDLDMPTLLRDGQFDSGPREERKLASGKDAPRS
jgi:cell division protein FtsZ